MPDSSILHHRLELGQAAKILSLSPSSPQKSLCQKCTNAQCSNVDSRSTDLLKDPLILFFNIKPLTTGIITGAILFT